jgi:hypothetical protein
MGYERVKVQFQTTLSMRRIGIAQSNRILVELFANLRFSTPVIQLREQIAPLPRSILALVT